jgi:Family of unknown function (DUF6504)
MSRSLCLLPALLLNTTRRRGWRRQRRRRHGHGATAVTKRYREAVEVAHTDDGPVTFAWRGSTYRVLTVLGHWREDAAYWAGGGIEVPQRDLWRVEARNGTPAQGVYELVCESGAWRLDRVWD